MENNEFDQALRDFTNGSALPYDPRQWDRMAERLDAHGDAPKSVVSQQIIPFLPWTVSTAAACLLFTIMWLTPRTPSAIHPAQLASVAHQPTQVAPPQHADLQKPEPMQQPGGRAAAGSPTAYFPPVKKTNLTAPTSLAAVAEIRPEAQIPTSDSVPAPAANTVGKSNPVAKVNPFILPPDLPQGEPRSAGRKTAFGVLGGYNIGQAKNNFTLGVSVKQKLSDRFNIETGLAVVTGAYETFPETGTANMGFGASPAKAAAEPASTNLTYLQAAPSLNYRIYRGLSAGGGMDAQRLLSKNPQTVTMNSFGDSEETDAQAEWDFGLTARMDIQVVKKLRAGMMYRESVHRISKGPQEVAGRNYLLLQLSYTIY